MANPQNPPPTPSVSRIDWRRVAASPWTIGFGVSCLLAAMASVSLQRKFLGVSVESDFTGSFAREAERILTGQALELPSHPPGYPFVVALGRRAVRRMARGCPLDIRNFSSHFPHRQHCDLPQAGGDSRVVGRAFGVRLFNAGPGVRLHRLERHVLCGAGLSPVGPDRSRARGPTPPAALGRLGVLAACVLLTRTNGLVAAAVLALPWLVPAHEANRARNFAALAAVSCCRCLRGSFTPPARIRPGGPSATTGISRLRLTLRGPRSGARRKPRCRPTCRPWRTSWLTIP